MNKIASIDIGSNTVRFLILEFDRKQNFQIIASHRVITRLGEGMDTQGKLMEPRMSATLSALSTFQQDCKRHGNPPLHAVATSAVREASNGKDFVRLAREQTGIKIEIIPWEEEARLTLEGVFWKIPHKNRRTLTFDIGGGSTEFILSEGKKIVGFCSSPLGVVRLTEKFIHKHPVDHTEYENLVLHLRTELKSIKEKLSTLIPEVLIGTAGTVTTLAALNENIYPYDPDKIHGTLIPRQDIERLAQELKNKSLDERLELKPLEKGREDLIIAGTVIVLETMRAFQCDPLLVSEYSLREGIILKALKALETNTP
ncbi:MAG: Ppx/GppA family phosphatase [Nitrospinae bacterium]|nr:Ppx/GppA family phosphatase [Nitrospinota bacterium]